MEWLNIKLFICLPKRKKVLSQTIRIFDIRLEIEFSEKPLEEQIQELKFINEGLQLKIKSLENVWKNSEKDREILQKEIETMRNSIVTSRRSLRGREKVKEQNNVLIEEREKLNEQVAKLEKELHTFKIHCKKLEEEKQKLSETLSAKVNKNNCVGQ